MVASGLGLNLKLCIYYWQVLEVGIFNMIYQADLYTFKCLAAISDAKAHISARVTG
ncbi:MAG: hypothetical protein ABL865_07575 [Candidatus Nitrotoga sp.]